MTVVSTVKPKSRGSGRCAGGRVDAAVGVGVLMEGHDSMQSKCRSSTQTELSCIVGGKSLSEGGLCGDADPKIEGRVDGGGCGGGGGNGETSALVSRPCHSGPSSSTVVEAK